MVMAMASVSFSSSSLSPLSASSCGHCGCGGSSAGSWGCLQKVLVVAIDAGAGWSSTGALQVAPVYPMPHLAAGSLPLLASQPDSALPTWWCFSRATVSRWSPWAHWRMTPEGMVSIQARH